MKKVYRQLRLIVSRNLKGNNRSIKYKPTERKAGYI